MLQELPSPFSRFTPAEFVRSRISPYISLAFLSLASWTATISSAQLKNADEFLAMDPRKQQKKKDDSRPSPYLH